MAFTFKKQPFKALYLFYAFVSILFVRLPIWFITSIIPSNRPRPSWSITLSVVTRALQATVAVFYEVGYPEPPVPSEIAAASKSPCIVSVSGIPTDLIVGDLASASKRNDVSPVTVCGYWLGKDGEPLRQTPAKASDRERALLVLHGGGHVSGSADPQKDNTAVAPSILEMANGVILRALSLEYRLSAASPFTPVNPFPSSLLDVIAGYRYLLKEGFSPANIVVCGVSSGGHLAVALALYLARSKLESLPLPGGLLLLSPTLDWAGTHEKDPTCSMIRNRPCDIVEPILNSGYTGRALLGSLPANELSTNPYLSPASLSLPQVQGLFCDFPPTCIVAGEAEQTLDPMHTFRDRLVADIGAESVRFLEYPDANHTFLTLALFEPQRDNALRNINEWLSDLAK